MALQFQLLEFLKEVLGPQRLGASLGNTASFIKRQRPRQTDRQMRGQRKGKEAGKKPKVALVAGGSP